MCRTIMCSIPGNLWPYRGKVPWAGQNWTLEHININTKEKWYDHKRNRQWDEITMTMAIRMTITVTVVKGCWVPLSHGCNIFNQPFVVSVSPHLWIICCEWSCVQQFLYRFLRHNYHRADVRIHRTKWKSLKKLWIHKEKEQVIILFMINRIKCPLATAP